jgi:hypothetical protein
VKLEDNTCGTITSETGDVVYSITYDPRQPSKPRQLYNRPAYFHIRGMPDIKVGDMHSLIYTGRKWFGISVNVLEMNVTLDMLSDRRDNFHGECLS